MVAEDTPVLAELADHDARADAPRPGCQREAAEQRLDERRLARPVGADERDPLGPGDVQRERAQREVAALDDRVLQAHDDVARPGRLVDGEAQVPSLPGLLDHLQRVEGALGAPRPPGQRLGPVDAEVPLRLVVVARVLLLLGHAGGGPLALALGPPAQLGPLRLVDGVGLVGMGLVGGALGPVARPTAAVGARPSASARPARGRRSPCVRGRRGRATR